MNPRRGNTHIRKTPINLFAKPQNPRGIAGIANIADICVEAFFIYTTLMEWGFHFHRGVLEMPTHGIYPQNPQNPSQTVRGVSWCTT